MDTTPSRRKHLASKRTNSLGWAKSDCHTCSQLQRHCDRRRPRCSACLADGVICSGYVQQLNWERGSLRHGKSKQKAPSNELAIPQPQESTSQLPQPSAFIFVDQSQLPDRSKRKSRNNSKSCEAATDASQDHLGFGGSLGWDTVSPTSPASSLSLTRTNTPPSIADYQSLMFTLSPQIYRPSGNVEDALSFYHGSFSYTTLTFHVQVNPWQAALPQIQDGIPCVRYAAIALARRQQAHLLNKPESLSVLRLKDSVLSIFGTHLNDLSLESGISTSLLLIALDYAETGFSNWTIHLRGAFRMLESNGGIRLAESRPNLRSQIAMLIWYDVTAALISRCGPVFPRRYLEALMLWQSDCEWSILALNGLPDTMFLDMFDFTVAAAAPESVPREMATEFNTRILKAEIDGRGNNQLALMSKVWKLGLLLYCARLFPPPNQELDGDLNVDDMAPAQHSSTRSRCHALATEILTIVSTLPPDSNFQKQCLMPIILASCEMSASPADARLRNVAMDYGERWRQRTGIWIFDSALEFMRGVWRRNDHLRTWETNEEAEAEAEAEGGVAVPWTEIFPPGLEHGFLFG